MNAMKAILRQALEEAAVTRGQLAAHLQRPYHYVSDALNDSEPQPFPAELLVPFLHATNLTPLRWLASQVGCAVVQLPAVAVTPGDLRDRFMKAVEEVGKDSAAIQRAFADGQMTTDEGRDLVAELSNTRDVFCEVIAMVEAKTPKPSAARMALPAPAPAETRRRA